MVFKVSNVRIEYGLLTTRSMVQEVFEFTFCMKQLFTVYFMEINMFVRGTVGGGDRRCRRDVNTQQSSHGCAK